MIMFYSTNSRPMKLEGGIVAHIKPLSTPQMLEMEALWSGNGFDGMLAALKYAGPIAVTKIDGLKDERGTGVDSPDNFTSEWFERLNPEGISAFLKAIMDVVEPSQEAGNV